MNTVTKPSTLAHTKPAIAQPASGFRAIGWWLDDATGLQQAKTDTLDHNLGDIRRPVYVLNRDGAMVFASQGTANLGTTDYPDDALPLIGYLPPMSLSQLGDTSFCNDYGIDLPYMTGSMANGIASTRLVIAVAKAGLLASFGAAGLTIKQIEQAIIELKRDLPEKNYCFNLIHSPNEKSHELAVVALYLLHGIRFVEASAYMALTLPVVHYRLAGIHLDDLGNIVTPNRIIAKASRVEVASRWLSPPPDKFITELLENGEITHEQAELAKRIPMAQDLTVEADSGGHTDNRPAITLLPTMIALRNRLQKKFNYSTSLRIGAAGGIATPESAAAAYALGAAYIVTGTINQACIESGSSDLARQMLTEAKQADVTMAPAVDMFEMGVKLQVLKRGTMFAMRGNKLYELYRSYQSIGEIPQKQRNEIETQIFKATLDEIWLKTKEFFMERGDPEQITRAEKDKKYKMSLIFRWYLGLSSRWANSGEPSRQVDYQIWCGPSMGAFNEWSNSSFLESPSNRKVVTVAMNIMYGAAQVTRLNMLRTQGINLSSKMSQVTPLALSEIENRISA